ncbi:MAG: sodium/solute symporter [Terriglobia bacterium]
MEWIVSHRVPLVFLCLYVLLLVYHAWVGHRATRGVLDYYVGGRRMGGWALGLSFFATYSSTNSYIGLAGQSYSFGVSWFLLGVFLVGFSVLAWLFVAPRLRRVTEQLGSLTVSDFLGFRFSSTAVRSAAAAIILFSSLFYMTAIFKGAGELLAAFLHLPYAAAVVLIFTLVVFYTYTGGFISVVKTDAVQGGMMIVAAVVLFAATYARVDGWSGLVAALSHSPRALSDGRPLVEGLLSLRGPAPPLILLGLIFAGSIKFLVEPRQLSRFYALKDGRAARRGLVASTVAIALVYACILPLGLLARAVYPTGVEDTDRIVPLLLTQGEIVGSHLAAFILVVLLAAAMSSLDSVLLVVASTWQRDLVEVWRPSPSEARMLAGTRFYVLVLAVVTMLIALRPPGGIVALTVFSGSIYAACFLPALLFGLFWRGGSAAAVLGSFATGLVALAAWPPLTRVWPALQDTHAVFPAVLLSSGIFLALSLFRRARPA